MYYLIRIYTDGTIVTGHHAYEEWALDELSLLVSEVKSITYELVIGMEIE